MEGGQGRSARGRRVLYAPLSELMWLELGGMAALTNAVSATFYRHSAREREQKGMNFVYCVAEVNSA